MTSVLGENSSIAQVVDRGDLSGGSIHTSAPLSCEARSIRSAFSSHNDLIEVVESQISSMEQSDVKKLKLFKVAITILTIVGLAILFVLPLCMVCGVSLWVPVVVVGLSSIAIGFSGNKLRQRYEEIKAKYRLLNRYYSHLLSQHVDVKKSALYKYDISLNNTKTTRDLILEKLCPDKHKKTFDGGISLDEKLNLSGELNSRYQVEALFGIDSSEDAEWKKFIASVSNAKIGLLQGKSANSDLDNIAKSALQNVEGSIASKGLINFVDLSKTIMSVCQFGGQVGLEVRKIIEAYDASCASSPTVCGWVSTLSPHTKLYFTQAAASIDQSLCIFEDLNRLVSNLHFANWCEKFDIFLSEINHLEEIDDITLNSLKTVKHLAHELCTHDASNEKLNAIIRNIVKVSENCVEVALSSSGKIVKIEENIHEFVNAIHQQKRKIFGKDEQRGSSVSDTAEQALVCYLAKLGPIDKLLDKVRSASFLGKYVLQDIERAASHHPDFRYKQECAKVDMLLYRLSQKDWGASSTKSVEAILSEKQELVQYLEQAKQCLVDWSDKYSTFKDQKMSRLLLKEFSEALPEVQKDIISLGTTPVGTSQTYEFILERKAFLDSEFKNLLENQNLPSEEEITSFSKDYQRLLQELEQIHVAIEAASVKVKEEGISHKSLVWQTLFNRESTLAKKKIKKATELAKSIEKKQSSDCPSSTTTILKIVMQKMSSIVESMNSLDRAIGDGNNIDLDRVRVAANSLFSSMNTLDPQYLSSLKAVLTVGSQETQIGTGNQNENRSVLEFNESQATNLSQDLRATQSSQVRSLGIRHKQLSQFLTNVEKQSRNWKLSRDLVMVLLGLVGLVISLVLLSVQITWLPIGICALAVVFQFIPMFFNKKISQKEQDVEVARLAKAMSGEINVISERFKPENIQNLSRIQSELNLDGVELAWSRAVHEDIEEIDKQSNFRATIANLRSDARTLNRLMNSSSYGAAGNEKGPQEQQLVKKETSQEDARRCKQVKTIDNALAELSISEHKIIQQLISYNKEVTKYYKQKHYQASLKSSIDDILSSSLPNWQNSVVENQRSVEILSQALSEKAEELKSVDPTSLEQVLTLTSQIYHNSGSKTEKDSAKEAFSHLLKDLSSKGELDALRNSLELGMCTGGTDLKYNQYRQDKARSGVLTQTIESKLSHTEELLKLHSLAHVVPFLRFSSSQLSDSGRTMAESILKETGLLLEKIENSEVTPDDYKRVNNLLSRYLERHDNLKHLTYDGVLGGQHFQNVASLIREKHALSNIVSLNISLNRKDLCKLALKRIDRWISRKCAKHSYSKICSDFMMYLRSCLDNNSDSSNCSTTEDFQEIYNSIKKLPRYVLLDRLQNSRVQFLINAQNIQNLEKKQRELQVLDQILNEKDKMFSENKTDWDNRIGELKERLKSIGKEQESLLLEKQRIALG
ncbi:hypothetical protein CP10139811_0228 [Chlamydia ibidis]|uniref:Transmembrane protein n=2 Tax=Chlamydia ibidis TaxID=1405396 RepID=S7J2T5_9CHLA|nr:hypothetical protein [Chlamydia ibidis]EPP34312.1 hypothetical protein CP10139811_0228 [Chlamydia ibidis]EQM62761.1 hypothetical protein H359_0673 [Chlamydia ibidis 10-1398/6]